MVIFLTSDVLMFKYYCNVYTKNSGFIWKMRALAVLFWTLISLSRGADELKFPPWFKFGSSSSSIQVEGAWNISDKGESKWEHLIHKYPELVADSTNSDITCDSYHNWKRDIEMVSELGLQYYRFSISWPRLLPNGFANKISQDGRRYYSNLINGLLEKGIEPIITIYHFELPQILQDLGGWLNPLISDWYADYARVVYSLFGDRVKTFITINEPQLECDWYYGSTIIMKPSLDHNLGSYICNKYILIAHAKAWRLYDEEFRHKYNGKVSITNHLLWLMPYSEQDENLTETSRQFVEARKILGPLKGYICSQVQHTEDLRKYVTGRYSHPIFSKDGGWPPIVEETISKVSKQLGYSRTRLPPFTQDEIKLIRGTFDFYGMNHYTTFLVRPVRAWEQVNSFVFTSVPEINAVFDIDPKWRFGFNKYMPINPVGIRQQMQWLRKQYGDIEILITENGFSTSGSKLDDDDRVSFIKAHLEQVLLAINEGINVTGYSYWSLMDDFEWFDGHKSRFGLYEVDFSDPKRRRTPRKSALYYSSVIKNRSLNVIPLHNSKNNL